MHLANAVVLDGNERSALAVTRSLAAKGIRIAVGSQGQRCLASSSRGCNFSFSYPSPHETPDEFVNFMRETMATLHRAVLLPVTDVTVAEILRHRHLFQGSSVLPFADYSKYLAVSDKANLFALAQQVKVPVPGTIICSGTDPSSPIIKEVKKIGFPVVIKPAYSRVRLDNAWINTRVSYANDVFALTKILEEKPFGGIPFLIQERIKGPGLGIFLLMKDREVLARFAHKRIREKPPSGGVSVLCESIEPPPEALRAAETLLRSVDWFGAAMVEFKWDQRDNQPKLMEVNARFWGSLQLAISAGVDFPYMLYRLATGGRVAPMLEYKTGLKSRWELGDLDHLLIRLRKKPEAISLPEGAPSRRKVLADFLLDFVRPTVRNQIFELTDPGPFLFELKQYIRQVLS